MSDRLLLDTHTTFWLGKQLAISRSALTRISIAASTHSLYVSDITLWELGVACLKRNIPRRPDLSGHTPASWLRDTADKLGAIRLRISAEIAAEASLVPLVTGYGDPGDCFLIATARIHALTLVTRDARILALSEAQPDYVEAIAC